MFLTREQLRDFTGFAIRAKQIAQLRKMGVAFHVNGQGRAIVTVAAVEGKEEQKTRQSWEPACLRGDREAA